MIKNVEFIVKSFPLIFIFLIIVGYANLQLFYNYFGINIINYIELSEVPLIFLEYGIFSILYIPLSFFVATLVDQQNSKISEGVNQEEDLNKKIEILEEHHKKTSSTYKKLNVILGSVLFLLLILMVISVIIQKNYIELVYPAGFVIMAFIFLFVPKKIEKSLVEKLDVKTIVIAIIIFGATLLLLLETITDPIVKGYELKYQNKTFRQISFEYNSQKIETDSTLNYIGETKNNIFLLDRINNQTLVYKLDNVINLKILLDNDENRKNIKSNDSIVKKSSPKNRLDQR